MRNFLFFLLLITVIIGLSNDYSFTITGELPVTKMSLPSDIFDFEVVLGFEPEKRKLNLNSTPLMPTLSLTSPSKEEEIMYARSKKIALIQVFDAPPEKFHIERTFFHFHDFSLIHKPLKMSIVDQKTGGIAVSLLKRLDLKIPEIVYHSKMRTLSLPAPPLNEPVRLIEERIVTKEAIGYKPIKSSSSSQSRISLGTDNLQQYRVGFSNSFLDTLLSTDKSRLFFKTDSLFIGAEASLNEITAIANFPGFEFKTDLFDDTFVLRTVTTIERLPSFDFGMVLMNTTPLPVINWYTAGSTNLFSFGVDVFSRSSYGLEVRLKNDPFVIRGGTGYDFQTEAFHAVVDGRYSFDRSLLNASFSYNDGVSMGIGAEYTLVNNNPFSMNIYGNIDYKEDWLFSAGTKIRFGDFDLQARIKFITGGLSVDVEAGYSF